MQGRNGKSWDGEKWVQRSAWIDDRACQETIYGRCAACGKAGDLHSYVRRLTPRSLAMSYLDYNCCDSVCAVSFMATVEAQLARAK